VSLINILFGFVVCCFFISIIKLRVNVSRDGMYLCAGMFFTVVSDFLMVVLRLNSAGLACFCIVQLIYNARFAGAKKAAAVLFLAAAVFTAGSFAAFALEYRLAAAYAVCIISAVRACIKKRANLPCVLGMTLFLLCDVNVAFFNLIGGQVFFVLIWVFYLPSQMALAFSAER